ncbi:hypothetical protein D3C78_920880 [compost metagenome]
MLGIDITGEVQAIQAGAIQDAILTLPQFEVAVITSTTNQIVNTGATVQIVIASLGVQLIVALASLQAIITIPGVHAVVSLIATQ